VNLTVSGPGGSDSENKTNYITVSPAPVAPVITTQPSSQTVTAGQTATFTAAASGNPTPTVQWQVSTNGGVSFGDITGATSTTYTTPTTSAMNGYRYRAVFTNSVGTATSNVAILTVNINQEDHGGVALTFDDTYINDWYNIRQILQEYNAHATFFVSNLNNVDASEREKLRILQADGNEIAFHGYHHVDVLDYLQSHSVDEYMNDDILPGIELMQSWGFNPVDFAAPGGSHDEQATDALLEYFDHVRFTTSQIVDGVYYTRGSNAGICWGIGIDTYYWYHTDEYILNGMSTAKNSDRILIFYGHQPVENAYPLSEQTSYARLRLILQYASENNMRTYTINEIN
jgi:peptidoglycan/xylan/chitin deacetylase (PgdA/CDA1 family)